MNYHIQHVKMASTNNNPNLQMTINSFLRNNQSLKQCSNGIVSLEQYSNTLHSKPTSASIQPTYTKIGPFIPAFKPTAKLNIYIGKRETKIASDSINKPFNNTSMLYHYLDVSTASQITDKKMYLYQTNLHSKGTNEILHGIISPNEKDRIQKCNGDKSDNITGLTNAFLTAKQIYNKYGIIPQHLPKSSRDIHKLKQHMTKQTIINVNILNNFNWYGKINTFAPTYKSKKNKVPMKAVQLRVNEWINICTESWDNYAAIAIVVYENINDNGFTFNYWIGWVKLVYIKESNSYIGVSFKEYNNGNGFIYMPSIMELSVGHVCHLYVLLLCISNGLNDINKREKVSSNLLKDVIDSFNPLQIHNVINNNIKFAYHIRTLLDMLQSTLTANALKLNMYFQISSIFYSPNVFARNNVCFHFYHCTCNSFVFVSICVSVSAYWADIVSVLCLRHMLFVFLSRSIYIEMWV